MANRGCSIRIPRDVAEKRCGYLEDRRPSSNCDPYQVSAYLLTNLNFGSKMIGSSKFHGFLKMLASSMYPVNLEIGGINSYAITHFFPGDRSIG